MEYIVNRSNNAYDGTLVTNMKVTKREDGKYEASFPAIPKLPPVVGSSESDAVNRARVAVQEAHNKGEIGN